MKEEKSLSIYKIRFYKTEEHYEYDVFEVVDDKFYTKRACIAKMQDLLYKLLYYATEYYKENNPDKVLGELTVKTFDRSNYYHSIVTEKIKRKYGK